MKNWILASLLLIVGCHSVTPGPGEEAVLVMKPLIFGHGGVDDDAIKTGRTFVAWTTSAVIVNTQPMQFPHAFQDLMTTDGVPLDFDSVIRLQVLDSAKLIKEFGPNWFEQNVEVEFSNRVRQAVRKHGMNETALKSTAIDDIDREVSGAMDEYIKASGLPLRLIQVTVGRANPPDSIKNQRVETAAQEQRIQTEQQRKLAEDSRREAEMSRAAADNAYREAMQLSPDQFLKLETIKMQRAVCEKGGCTWLIGTGAVPTVGVGK